MVTRGTAKKVPGRHGKRDACRTHWIAENLDQETPSPADYDPQRTASRASHVKFSQSARTDIENLPCLGPAPERQMLRSDIELFPGPAQYGAECGVKPVTSRVLGGPFPTSQRKDHIDEALKTSMHVPGPSHYDGGFTPTMSLPVGGKMSVVPMKGWLDLIVDRANDTPGPTHGHRIDQDNLSTKLNQNLGCKLQSKGYLHNYQTALQNAVCYHSETLHQQGPNQCRSDAAFNEQVLTYHKNAPSFSFGSDSCKQKQIQCHRQRQSANRLLPEPKQRANSKNNKMSAIPGYIAPRLSKRNDFEKYFGYNPGASESDLIKYFGYDRGLGNSGENMTASKSLSALAQSGKKYRKKPQKRRHGPQMGPQGQPRSIEGRAGYYIKIQPTPGPSYVPTSSMDGPKAIFGTD